MGWSVLTVARLVQETGRSVAALENGVDSRTAQEGVLSHIPTAGKHLERGQEEVVPDLRVAAVSLVTL